MTERENPGAANGSASTPDVRGRDPWLSRTVDEQDMEPALDAAIRQILCICFPREAAVFSQTRAWHGSAPAFSVVLLDGARVVALRSRAIRASMPRRRAVSDCATAVYTASGRVLNENSCTGNRAE